MVVKTSLPKGSIMMCKIKVKVNYFVAGRGKSLVCGFFSRYGDYPFLRVCAIPQFRNDILSNSLAEFFFV